MAKLDHRIELIDAIDLLQEARQINEAAHMACASIANQSQRDALQRILGLCGDTLGMAAHSLESMTPAASKVDVP